ncbi:hypothetical protein NIES3974_04410 [Calothrix sp. NIES-3974]|nr:hypothetical protein NIES3974_04410 [Calothrix sp. NIES-3974]
MVNIRDNPIYTANAANSGLLISCYLLSFIKLKS